MVEHSPAPVDLTVEHKSAPVDLATSLSARERMALFCAATGIEHPKTGSLASVIRALRSDGLLVYDRSLDRCLLTESGRAVFRDLLERSGFKLTD